MYKPPSSEAEPVTYSAISRDDSVLFNPQERITKL
jgi:hypothetical protein